MDGRSLTSLQMTISLIILSQIITLTHMLPVESRYRRLDLDLLLDPVHQEMQSDDLEDKRVVPKSVYHTQLRLTTESPCNSGSQRAKEGGPCLRINSSQGSLLDEKFLSSVLKDIHITRQGGRRKPNRNRNRSTTTTTEVPVVQSTLQQDQGEFYYDEQNPYLIYVVSPLNSNNNSQSSSSSCSHSVHRQSLFFTCAYWNHANLLLFITTALYLLPT